MAACARNFENVLFNQPVLSLIFGVLIYLPLMSIVFILWIIQSLIAIVIYMISIILSLCGITRCCQCPNRDSKIMDIINSTNNSTADHPTSDATRSSVTILQFNVFYLYGRFWTRKPMIEDMVRSLSPDIISVNEAIRTRIWNFGTVQMISNLWPDTHCDSVVSSVYHQWIVDFPSAGKYSFIWDYVLLELQLGLNVLFLLPFFRQFVWTLLLNRTSIWWYDIINAFTGYCVPMGNALIFRGSNMVNPDILPLTEGRTANRALYIDPKNENKKLWITNTHLTTAVESHDESKDVEQQTEHSAKQHQIEQIEMVLKWMEQAVSEHPADALIICGDFNVIPDSKAYRLMESHGFRSCGCEYLGKGQYVTYDSVTWTLLTEDLDEELGKSLILDYIWIKPLRDGVDVKIEDCRIVEEEFVNLQHRGEDIKVYPSDHYGVFVALSW